MGWAKKVYVPFYPCPPTLSTKRMTTETPTTNTQTTKTYKTKTTKTMITKKTKTMLTKKTNKKDNDHGHDNRINFKV